MPAGQQRDDPGVPTNDPGENDTPKVSVSPVIFTFNLSCRYIVFVNAK